MLWATLLLLLLLRCPQGGHGRRRSLDRPVQVRFVAETFHHVLHWEPGTNYTPEAARYDVQYKRYGSPSWTPASHCARIASQACDLSDHTWNPLQRYYARVRTVIGNCTSSWTQTSASFSPKEATLRLSNVSLSVTCNKIHVTLQLPVNKWKNVTSEDVYRRWLVYHVYVRRVSDGHQFMYVNASLEFDLQHLLWGERYCVSVEPRLVSRPNPGKRTEEQCISIPPKEDQVRTIVLPSFTLFSLAALGTFGMAWACVYVKKPMKTPSVLKSLLKSSSPWVPNELPALGIKDLVVCMEADSVQHLSVGLKNCTKPGSLKHHSTGAATPAPEESCRLPALRAEDKAESLELRDVVDSSGCSTDSGICLQEVSDSLSHLLDCSRLTLGSSKEEGGPQEDSSGFCGKKDPVLQPVLSSGAMEELALEVEEGRKPLNPSQALFPGYKKQLGGPSEALGSSKALPSTGEMAHSQLGLARGYLKQPSFVLPSGLGDVTLTKDIPSKTQRFAATVSLDVLGPLDLLSECPKTLSTGSFLEPAAFPHLSLWHPGCTQLILGLDLPRCRM